MARIHDIDLHLQMRPAKTARVIKYGYSGLKILNKGKSLFPSDKRRKVVTLEEVASFDEGVDLLWDKVKDGYRFILEKKSRFLNWRFSDNERGSYLKIQAKDKDGVLGYAVISQKEVDGYPEGQIVDLLALNDRPDVAEGLFSHCCSVFDGKGVNTVYYQVVEGHPYQKLSERFSFVNSHSNPYIILHESVKKGDDAEAIDLGTAPGQIYFNYAETI
jgi:hypothetical protein